MPTFNDAREDVALDTLALAKEDARCPMIARPHASCSASPH